MEKLAVGLLIAGAITLNPMLIGLATALTVASAARWLLR
jgi:hypothetical protein